MGIFKSRTYKTTPNFKKFWREADTVLGSFLEEQGRSLSWLENASPEAREEFIKSLGTEGAVKFNVRLRLGTFLRQAAWDYFRLERNVFEKTNLTYRLEKGDILAESASRTIMKDMIRIGKELAEKLGLE